MKSLLIASLFTTVISCFSTSIFSQVQQGERTGFTWINTEEVSSEGLGDGYTFYSAAWPMFKNYPGQDHVQLGLGSCWLSTERTGQEPDQFYTTIEGGLGWWHDTRFGKSVPKFIMGGVSYNFFAWANGPGAGRSDILPNGQRDWSSPGGKYGVAQLSNKVLWAPDGLNMAQSLQGELLGYGYRPLPITEPMVETAEQDIRTGNKCWTLFLNSTNFKGPISFFLPTFWTQPVLEDPLLEGLFLDTRPSDPNIGFGLEHAVSPAITSTDSNGQKYARIEPLQFPMTNEDNSMLLNKVSVYEENKLWNDLENWFNGGPTVVPESFMNHRQDLAFINNGGAIAGEISSQGIVNEIDLNYIQNIQLTNNIMGFEFDLTKVKKEQNYFVLPEYFKLGSDNLWQPIEQGEVPSSTDLTITSVPRSIRNETTYLTPMEPDCQWQDPNGAWRSPGPAAGPFKVDIGDGSTLTYYWYKFIDQPSIIQANLPESLRSKMQERVELIHTNWKHTDEYMAAPDIGNLATLDPAIIVEPPAGMEVGYVPIVTRQEKSPSKLRVFILAGQSNMQGYGTIEESEETPGTLVNVLKDDSEGLWSQIGEPGNWKTLEDAYLYFPNNGDVIKSNVTVGQGAFPDLFGPELMFAHTLDEYYEDPILIIKTAWGGKSLAVDFRPPSAGGQTGEFYDLMIQTVENVTQNLETEFPSINTTQYEISGFAWFQGWNDGEEDSYKDEYEINLHHLVSDVRNDLNLEQLPFVVVNSGHGGFEISVDLWVQDMQNIISVAQESVGCNDSIYGGRLGFVESKQFFVNSENSPEDAIHHFNNNASTFLNIGQSLGEEMILAINDMAYCYRNCENQISPGILSIGNRVWNDLNQNGINEDHEPGIANVSLVLWEDSDGDGIPDWQGFRGVQTTDENGYYRFTGLAPGPYVVFVWSVDNWDEGEPLHGFQSTNGFVNNADNDIDLDNNGFGNAYTDIMSGIVNLSFDDEPLNDGDPFNCYFDYDSNGNNTVDFGFFNPDITSINELELNNKWFQLSPNPAQAKLNLISNSKLSKAEIFNALGQKILDFTNLNSTAVLDISLLAKGSYVIKLTSDLEKKIAYKKFIKQ